MKRTFTFKTLAVLLCASFIATSCKNDGIETEIAGPSAAAFKEMRAQSLQDLTQTKTFKAEDGVVFTSSKGAKVTIHPNCLRDASNNLVSGDVALSFVEIYDRGNMVMTNKPVMGKDASGNLLPLVTGGEYNIQVKQGDKVLKPGCTFSVTVPAANTGGLDMDMKLWKGNINEAGDLVWEEVNPEGQGKEAGIGPNTETARYDIWGDSFGWANVDRFYNDARPKTQIKVVVPAEYNKENSGVFLAYEGEPNVLALLDTYDSKDHFFSEHYGFVPVGLNLHIVFVSESNGAVAYAIRKVKIEDKGIITIGKEEIKRETKSNLVNMINNLK